MPKYPNVVQRGKKFYYRYQYRKRRLEIGGFSTARQAYYEGRRYEDTTRYTASVSDMTVTELCNNYIDKHARVWNRPTTVSDVIGICTNHIIPVIGEYRVRDITPLQMVDYINNIKRTRAPAAAFNAARTLRRIFNKAVEWEIIPANPLRCRLPAQPKHVYTVIEPAQLFELVNNLEGRDKYIVATAGFVGLRRGEIAGLQWDDFQGNTLHLKRQVVRSRIAELKTEGSAGVVPLWPRYVRLMKRWRLQTVSDTWVFRGRGERPFSIDGWYHARWMKIRSQFDLPEGFRFHDLRHTFASMLLSGGAQPGDVQKLLRHSRLATTMDIYRHILPGQLEGTFEVFNGLGGENGGEGLELSL